MNKLVGATITKKKDGTIYYRSSITYSRKHISLGSFPTMELAHSAYKEAQSLLSSTNTILNYNSKTILSFEKWIIIINFRDNHLYFGTPIYLKKNFFEYHLSPTFCLKFDLEDLFYYSSHKIMKRKGHLFVADYGMQVTISNRYGIKNYGVVNKDYRFVNGDTHDYRYENIEVINTYQGVAEILHKGNILYQSKIHIHGNYVIGYYRNEINAAIAYNKAIDILIKKGSLKNYTQNYIIDYSNEDYAITYAKLKISKKILDYDFS